MDYEDVTVEVTLSSGKVLVCRRIPPNDLELFEDEHVPPPIPMREASAVGGVTEMVPDPDDEEYQRKLKVFEIQKMEDKRRMIFALVEFKDQPTKEELKELESWGIRTTKENLFRHFMPDYFVDWLVIEAEVMRISVVTEDEVQRALERFRRRMGRGAPLDEDGDSEESVQTGEGEGDGAPGA